MSWSVNAEGRPAEVMAKLGIQFTHPLADAPTGINDEGEKETVRLVSKLIVQCLETFDPNKEVAVAANGHMGFKDYDAKTGAYQAVHLSIEPKH